MELESEVGKLELVSAVGRQEGSEPSSSPGYQTVKYRGMSLALAQHSVDYCGDGMGDGCKND